MRVRQDARVLLNVRSPVHDERARRRIGHEVLDVLDVRLDEFFPVVWNMESRRLLDVLMAGRSSGDLQKSEAPALNVRWFTVTRSLCLSHMPATLGLRPFSPGGPSLAAVMFRKSARECAMRGSAFKTTCEPSVTNALQPACPAA